MQSFLKRVVVGTGTMQCSTGPLRVNLHPQWLAAFINCTVLLRVLRDTTHLPLACPACVLLAGLHQPLHVCSPGFPEVLMTAKSLLLWNYSLSHSLQALRWPLPGHYPGTCHLLWASSLPMILWYTSCCSPFVCPWTYKLLRPLAHWCSHEGQADLASSSPTFSQRGKPTSSLWPQQALQAPHIAPLYINLFWHKNTPDDQWIYHGMMAPCTVVCHLTVIWYLGCSEIVWDTAKTQYIILQQIQIHITYLQ